MLQWVRFPIRLLLFILSPLPWSSNLLQSIQFGLWVMVLIGMSQAHRIESFRGTISAIPGGTATIIASAFATLMLIAAWRLFYRLDSRGELGATARRIHEFIQEGSALQTQIMNLPATPVQSPGEYLTLHVELAEWMMRARGLVFEQFSESEASRFEYAIGFDGGTRTVTKEKLVDAMKRRLEYLYELQGRIANRMWALRP